MTGHNLMTNPAHANRFRSATLVVAQAGCCCNIGAATVMPSTDVGNPHHIRWPRARQQRDIGDGEEDDAAAVRQVATIDPATVGIPGTVVRWTTTDPAYPTISWTRLEAVPRQHAPVITPYGPTGLQYRRYTEPPEAAAGDGAAEVLPRPVRIPETIWGNTFVQGLRVGVASYHFLPLAGEDLSAGTVVVGREEPGEEGLVDGGQHQQQQELEVAEEYQQEHDERRQQQPHEMRAYISYEHPDCAAWPPLDNGAPVPARVYFRDVRYDAAARRFQGVIDWEGEYGTSWNGAARWQYDFICDPGFHLIVAGSVTQYQVGGDAAAEPDVYNTGVLRYINAGDVPGVAGADGILAQSQAFAALALAGASQSMLAGLYITARALES